MKLNKTDDTIALSMSKKTRALKQLGGKCFICECNDFVVLDFHHINNDKEKTFNELRDNRWSMIESEIKKCELLCANCHAEIHYKNAKNGQRFSKLLFDKNYTKCEICGYHGRSLDFHHRNPKDKKFSLSAALMSKVHVSIEEIEEELLKCSLLCRNCHRKLHFNYERFNNLKKAIEYKILNYKEKRRAINVDTVRDMLKIGMRQVEIVKKLGCAKSTIYEIIKRNNLV